MKTIFVFLINGFEETIQDAGFEIVMHVHDEAVLEVPIGHSGVDEVCALMAEAPAWADGLPLRADGYECRFYQKD